VKVTFTMESEKLKDILLAAEAFIAQGGTIKAGQNNNDILYEIEILNQMINFQKG